MFDFRRERELVHWFIHDANRYRRADIQCNSTPSNIALVLDTTSEANTPPARFMKRNLNFFFQSRRTLTRSHIFFFFISILKLVKNK